MTEFPSGWFEQKRICGSLLGSWTNLWVYQRARLWSSAASNKAPKILLGILCMVGLADRWTSLLHDQVLNTDILSPSLPLIDWFPQREILQSSTYRFKSASHVLEAIWRLMVEGSRFGSLTLEDVDFHTCFQFSPVPLLSLVSRVSKSRGSRVQRESACLLPEWGMVLARLHRCGQGSWTPYNYICSLCSISVNPPVFRRTPNFPSAGRSHVTLSLKWLW